MLTLQNTKCLESFKACQDFYIRPEKWKNFVLSHSSNLHTLFPIPPTKCDPACVLTSIWGQQHEGVAGLWKRNTEPSLTAPKPMALVPGKTRGKKCRTFPIWSAHPLCKPFWNAHPLRKPAGWCASSLHKQTTVCSLRPRGPLKSWPSGPPFHLVFGPSMKLLPCSSYVWLPLVTPLTGASFAPISCILLKITPSLLRT